MPDILHNSALATLSNLATATGQGSSSLDYLVPGDIQVATTGLSILASSSFFAPENVTQEAYISVRELRLGSPFVCCLFPHNTHITLPLLKFYIQSFMVMIKFHQRLQEMGHREPTSHSGDDSENKTSNSNTRMLVSFMCSHTQDSLEYITAQKNQ